MNEFVRFMNRLAGCAARVVLGPALIVGGVALGGAGGVALAVAGLVPIAMGGWGRCLVEFAMPGLRPPRPAACR
ncbi:MAG: DUF2892 domain-containing protein [Chloroflexi bacterium]|nr:DUF2892 domain-containing protein [Chloroflexota bacterium]